MTTQRWQRIIDQYGCKKVIETLSPFLLERRQARIQDVIERRLNSVQLAIEAPCDLNNAMAVIRSCEAFGVSSIHLVAIENNVHYVKTISRGTHYWVHIQYHKTTEDFIEFAQQQDFALAGGMVTAEQPLSAVPVNQKTLCLVMGNEHRGISPILQHALDHPFRIPISGMAESLNLSVSAGISLYDITQRKRQQLGRQGDIEPAQQALWQARYYLNSAENRVVEQLFPTSATLND